MKGAEVGAGAAAKEHASLQSGVAWHHRSSAASTESAAFSAYLDVVRRLRAAAPGPEGADERRQLTKELASADEAIREEQAHWKGDQDRLNQQTQAIVSALSGLVLSTAGLVTGVGAAAGVTQLIWAVSAAALTTTMNKALAYKIGRTNDTTVESVLRGGLEAILTSAAGMFLAQEACLAVDLWAMEAIHRNDDAAARIFGKPALGILKGQINRTVGDVTSAGVRRALGEGSMARLGPDVVQKIKADLANLPLSVVKTFFSGVVVNGAVEGYNAVFDGIDVHQRPSSAKANLSEKDGTDRADTAHDQLYGRGVGEGASVTDWINGQGALAGGPTKAMGASESIFDGGDDGNLLLAVKTAVYEVVLGEVGAKAGAMVDAAVEGPGEAGATDKKAGRRPKSDPDDDKRVTVIVARTLAAELEQRGLPVGKGHVSRSGVRRRAMAVLDETWAVGDTKNCYHKALLAREEKIEALVRKELGVGTRTPHTADATMDLP